MIVAALIIVVPRGWDVPILTLSVVHVVVSLSFVPRHEFISAFFLVLGEFLTEGSGGLRVDCHIDIIGGSLTGRILLFLSLGGTHVATPHSFKKVNKFN